MMQQPQMHGPPVGSGEREHDLRDCRPHTSLTAECETVAALVQSRRGEHGVVCATRFLHVFEQRRRVSRVRVHALCDLLRLQDSVFQRSVAVG